MELNWKEDNNLVRKIAKILLGDTLPNGEPVSSLVLLDDASRTELQRWADMSDEEFEKARQSGDTIRIDVDDEIKRITEEYGLDPNFLDDLLSDFDEDVDDDTEPFLDAGCEIAPELFAEIEEWEQQEYDEPEGYYFSNPDPYLKPTPLPPDHPRHNFWFDEDGHICAKNPSAFWLPEFTLQKEIGGTIYSVTGTYDGTETLDKKMERIMAEKFTEKLEDTE